MDTLVFTLDSEELELGAQVLADLPLRMEPGEQHGALAVALRPRRVGRWRVCAGGTSTGFTVAAPEPQFPESSVRGAGSALLGADPGELRDLAAWHLYAGRVFRITARGRGGPLSLIAKRYDAAPAGTFERDLAPYVAIAAQRSGLPAHWTDGLHPVLYLPDLGPDLAARERAGSDPPSAYRAELLERLIDLHMAPLPEAGGSGVRRLALVESDDVSWLDAIAVIQRSLACDAGALEGGSDPKNPGPATSLGADWRGELARLATDTAPGPSGLVHGDCHFSNLYRHGGRLYWTDMQGLQMGPPEIDLARLGVRAPAASLDFARTLHEDYLARREAREGNRFDRPAAHRRFALRWIAEAAQFIGFSLACAQRPWLFHAPIGGSLEQVARVRSALEEWLGATADFGELRQLWQRITTRPNALD